MPTGIICPHLGIPLNWAPERFLDLDGTLIQCSSHGALFQIDSGECIAGPCAWATSLQPVDARAAGDKNYCRYGQTSQCFLQAPIKSESAGAGRS
jgi:nitrite reductase/ring-hydroxylating ferredoxin subunit